MSRFVIDSYAILAVLREEDGASKVLDLIADRRHQRWMSVINVGEVYYQQARAQDFMGANRTLAWLQAIPMTIVEVGLLATTEAARIKAAYPISYADCFAAALARQMQASVVTGDSEFEQLERDNVVTVEWLPRKASR